MLRPVVAALAAIVIVASAAAAGSASLLQSDTDRPGGTYATLPADDQEACARDCARDGLCMAWSYAPAAGRACALKAVVTPARAAPGMTAGLAVRAPGFAALVGAAMTPVAAEAGAASLAPPAASARSRAAERGPAADDGPARAALTPVSLGAPLEPPAAVAAARPASGPARDLRQYSAPTGVAARPAGAGDSEDELLGGPNAPS